jgi:type IV pilus assembly PilX-like protein
MKNHRSSEAGSAYVITLLALVVLTILALSLALVTQTEVQVGANEKTVNRTFYAADSGLNIWLAERLGPNELLPPSRTVILNKVSVGAGSSLSTNVADRVSIPSAVLVNAYRCNWCRSDLGSDPLYHEDYVVSSTAQRIAWSGNVDPPADATVLGQKTLTVTYRVEPVSSPDVSQLLNSGNN